jgi:hypothetical protein
MVSPGNIDLTKIKVGDEVTIRAKVARNGGDRIYIAYDDGAEVDSVRFSPRDIVSHTPKAPEVGDTVRDTRRDRGAEDEQPWVLLHKDDSLFALVGRGNHTRAVKALSDLERLS